MSAGPDSRMSLSQLIRLLALIFGIMLFLVICGGIWLYIHETPPKEAELIAHFYRHRIAYEHLRKLLQEDTQTLSVDMESVRTATTSELGGTPPDGGVPGARYNEYLLLFKEVNSKGMFRKGGLGSPDVMISVWGAGFAGNTRHIDLAWLADKPANEIASLDDFYKTQQSQGPAGVFRHIEGNWYLWVDW